MSCIQSLLRSFNDRVDGDLADDYLNLHLWNEIDVNQGVGFLGNGATNIIAPISIIAIAIAALFGDGLAAFFNLNLGQGNTDKAAKGVGTAVIISSIVSVIYAVCAFIFLTPLCRIFGATDSIMPYALSYGRIIVIGFPFAIVATVINSAIRTDGSPAMRCSQ